MKKYKLISFTQLGEVEFKKVSNLELTFPCYIVLQDSDIIPERFNPDWFNYEEVGDFPTQNTFKIQPPQVPDLYVQKPWEPKYNKKVNKYKYTR